MIKNLLFAFVFSSFLLKAQEEKTIYFDQSWKETTKENAVFYRIQQSTKIDSIIYNRDFYSNGNLQNQWYSLKKNIHQRIGSSFWYEENGNDQSERFDFPSWEDKEIEKYKNLKLKFYYPNGKLWKIESINGFKHTDEVYAENGALVSKSYHDRLETDSIKYPNFPETKNFISRKFWKKTNNLAWEKFYEGKDHNSNIFKIIHYNENGIKTNEYNKENIIGGQIFNKPEMTFSYQNDFVVEAKPLKESFANVNQVLRLNNIDYISKKNQNLVFCSDNEVFYFGYYSTYEKRESRVYSILKQQKSEIKDFPKENYYRISEIKSQSIDELIKKIQNSVFTLEDNSKVKFRYFFLTPEILVKQELRFRDDKLRGFGSVEVRDDNHIEKWRIDRASFHTVRIININGEKPILQATGGEDINIISTNEGLFFNNQLATESKIETIKEDESGLNRTLYLFNHNDYYLVKEKNGKQNLYNRFGKVIFEADEISFNSKFILIKNLDKVEIYNQFLENITPDGTISAHLYPDFVNILQNNEVRNINFLGQTYYKPSIQTMECGTGRCSHSENLEQDKETRKLKLSTSSSCDSGSFYKNITFKNLENVESELVSIRNLKENNETASKYFTEKEEKYFIISKNGKFGLYTYNEKDSKPIVEDRKKIEKKPEQLVSYRTIIDKKTKKKKVIKDIFLMPEPTLAAISDVDMRTTNYTTNANELLPIENDKIELRKGLFIITNKGLHQIYNHQTFYKNIGKRAGAFIEIESLTNKKGWLDLETNQEFYNN